MNASGSHTFTFLCKKHANECTSRERTAGKERNHTDSESEEETSQAKAIPGHWGTMLRDNTYQSKQETHCLTPVTFEHVQHTYKNYIAQLADDKWSKQVCAICQEGRQCPKLFHMLEWCVFAGVFMCDMHKPNVQMEVFLKHVQEHEELAPFLLQDADSNTITCWPTNAMLAPQHITNLMMVLQRGNLRFHIDPSGVLDATDSNGNSCHFVQVCKKCYKCM